ncbi:hypothetical protein [Pseudoalteromonas marina]|uniref:Uncharacterized protein n=1 Tax=Pseudoalteromonas marina TaxID=267375 RepID=A0ABT9FI81_9GAMM|nr:hypothetical protein [Pseudoalteromonas marina]MDP2566469.1 hypothetical protein [Pseudoalteromonas marina]
MNTLEKLELGCFGIVITSNKGNENTGAAIASNMKEVDSPENHGFNLCVDAIESLVLSHYCAGIDVSSPAYLQGIETALDALGNIDVDLSHKKESLLEAIGCADLLTIDGKLVRDFNLYEFDEGVDDVDGALCLHAGSYQFTFDEINDAVRSSASTWLVKNNGLECQIKCERMLAL